MSDQETEYGRVVEVFNGGRFAAIQVGDRRDPDGNLCPWGRVPISGDPAFVGQTRPVNFLGGNRSAPVSPPATGQVLAGAASEPPPGPPPEQPVSWHMMHRAISGSTWSPTTPRNPSWSFDSEWEIAGPPRRTVAYTINEIGYIAGQNNATGEIQAWNAETAASVWTRDLGAGTWHLAFDAHQNELVVYAGTTTYVLSPADGSIIAGPTTIPDLLQVEPNNDNMGRVTVREGLLFGQSPEPHTEENGNGTLGPRWMIWERDPTNAATHVQRGYTDRLFVTTGSHDWRVNLPTTPDGHAMAVVQCKPSDEAGDPDGRGILTMWMINLATGGAIKRREEIIPPPPDWGSPGVSGSSWSWQHAMWVDGSLFVRGWKFRTGGTPSGATFFTWCFAPSGATRWTLERDETFSATRPGGLYPVSPTDLLSASIATDDHIERINSGSVAWTASDYRLDELQKGGAWPNGTCFGGAGDDGANPWVVIFRPSVPGVGLLDPVTGLVPSGVGWSSGSAGILYSDGIIYFEDAEEKLRRRI